MIRKFYLVLFCFLILCGCSKIVLKKRVVESAPFKGEKGTYEVILSRVNYPEGIFERAKFWNEFYAFSAKMLIAQKKSVLLIPEDIVRDLEIVKKGELTEKEGLFYRTASSLNDDEKENIRNILDVTEKNKEILTTQDYLNMQVKIMLKILGNESEFLPEKIYTELEKENIVNKVREKRKMIKESLENSKVSIIVEISETYKDIYTKKQSIYKRDIQFYTKSSFSERISKYEYPVYLKNVNEEDLEKIFEGEMSLKNKVTFIDNLKYNGYKYKEGKYIFFIGGSKIYDQFEEYKIRFTVKELKFEDILSSEEKEGLNDIIGG